MGRRASVRVGQEVGMTHEDGEHVAGRCLASRSWFTLNRTRPYPLLTRNRNEERS